MPKNTPAANHYLKAFASTLFLYAVTIVCAQADDSKGDETTVLSPFVVSTETDRGYAATQTLAGTRLRTDLRDTPVSLTVLTEDLLNDIAATGLDSLVDFVPNTSTFALGNGDDSGNSSKVGDTLSVRGFKTQSATRNFFQTLGFNDRYITNRITFSRGPNSLLFGIGNPGGAVHISTNRAELRRNRGTVTYQYDNYGSHRATVDQNITLIPERLAVRFDLLYQDSEGFREPTYDRKDGAFLTTTWNPFDNGGKTQIRLNYEYGKWDRVAARPWAPFDLFSTWVNAGAPLYNNKSNRRPGTTPSLNNPFIRFENSFVNILSQDEISTFRTAISPGYNSYVRSAGVIANGAEQTGNSITSDFVALNPLDTLLTHFGGNRAQLESWLAGLGGSRSIPELWRDAGPVTVPMETFFSGNQDRYVRDFRAYSGFLDHQVGSNLFLEVAANIEQAEVNNLTMMRATDYGIQYDPNLYLPNGDPNPYAGMPYVSSNIFATQEISHQETREYRATATYQLDLRDKVRGRLLNPGRHILAVLGNRFESRSDSQQDRPAVTEWGGQPIQSIAGFGAGVRAGTANVRGRYYLLPGTPPYIPEPWLPLKGEGVVGRSDWINFNAGRNQDTIDSLAVSTQSFFLNDRLVLTAGWRNDRLRQYTTTQQLVSAAAADPANGVYFNEVDREATFRTLALESARSWDNHSIGAVAHLTRNLSVFCNAATNVSGASTQYNIFYEPLSPNSGKGVDYGIKFQLFDRKLTGTLTRYETSQVDSFVNSGFLFGRGGITNAVDSILEILDPTEKARRDGITQAWVPVFDSRTTGEELELVWSATRSLRFRGTYSTQANVISGFAQDIDAYLDSSRETWDAYVAQNYDPSFTGPVNPANPTPAELAKINADIVREALEAIDQEMPLKRGFNGIPSLGLPKYAVSFMGTFDLPRDSIMKGVTVGASLRYRGPVTLAFEQDAAGITNLDNSFSAPGSRNWDFFINYKRKLFNNRYDWRIQVNIKNVFNEDDPNYLTGMWDRNTQSFLYTRNLMKEPRSLILTATLGW